MFAKPALSYQLIHGRDSPNLAPYKLKNGQFLSVELKIADIRARFRLLSRTIYDLVSLIL